ncbi:DUF977 family protein [Escherichia coli]
MAKVFTQEEREKIKEQVVELVRQSGRETLRQLEAKTGATRYLMSILARELVASGDVYNSDGEIRRYDSRLNIICRECRKSEVMKRVLAFYQGNLRYL